MIHRAYFFDSVRHYLDADRALSQEQVDGLELLLGYYDAPTGADFDDRMLAYVLATTWHETAFRVQPIQEYGSQAYLKAKPYYPWYGRGYVQLTWESNYQHQDEKLGLRGTLLANPDLALRPAIATPVLFRGMLDGDFTGRKLGDYFTPDLTDWYNAREIVNGHDCASDIAAYAEKFLNAISHTFDPPRAVIGRTTQEERRSMEQRKPEPDAEPIPPENGDDDADATPPPPPDKSRDPSDPSDPTA